MKWHGAWLLLWCTQNFRRDGCSFIWHQPSQRCKYTTSVDIQKTRYKKLVIHVEPHASAVSLLKRAENSAIIISDHQSINQSINLCVCVCNITVLVDWAKNTKSLSLSLWLIGRKTPTLALSVVRVMHYLFLSSLLFFLLPFLPFVPLYRCCL